MLLLYVTSPRGHFDLNYFLIPDLLLASFGVLWMESTNMKLVLEVSVNISPFHSLLRVTLQFLLCPARFYRSYWTQCFVPQS